MKQIPIPKEKAWWGWGAGGVGAGTVRRQNGLGQAPWPRPGPSHLLTLVQRQLPRTQSSKNLGLVSAELQHACAEGSGWLRGPGVAQQALLPQAGLQCGAPCVPLGWWGPDRQVSQRAVCPHGLPAPTRTQQTQRALILTLALCAKHEHPLASDDLELVVLAAAGHLNGSQRDHALGEGILERQSSDT